MDSFALAAGVMAPLLVWMVIGYLLRNALELSGKWVRVTNNLVFYLLLPLMLLCNIQDGDLSGLFTGEAAGNIGFGMAASAVTFAALMLMVPRLTSQNQRRGVLVQGIFRTNLALFGLPVAVMMYGEGQVGMIALLLAIFVPVSNALSVVALEYFRSKRVSWGRILLRIISNPVVIAALAGLALNFFSLRLPAALQTAASSLADCATPVSFIALGAGFSFTSAAQNRRALIWATAARLVLVPLVWVGIAALLGFRGQSLFGILVLTAPPTAVSSFPMACAMGGDERLAGEIVVTTSVAAVATVFLWIFALDLLMLV